MISPSHTSMSAPPQLKYCFAFIASSNVRHHCSIKRRSTQSKVEQAPLLRLALRYTLNAGKLEESLSGSKGIPLNLSAEVASGSVPDEVEIDEIV